MSTSTHTVVGMTCDHCVRAVTEEVKGIDNVKDVSIDLASGTVTIEAEGAVDEAALRAAVDEAGYELQS